MPIYTKTGDRGETSLLGGKRVGKDSLVIKAIGEIDELNAALGIGVAFLQDEKLKLFIQSIQRDLFKIGAELAGLHMEVPTQGRDARFSNQIIDLEKIGKMEKMIDEFWAQLPPLRNFILPGGGLAAGQLHLARAVCRRAERQLVDFAKQNTMRPELNIYLNRLSDWLFAAARWVNFQAGEGEIRV